MTSNSIINKFLDNIKEVKGFSENTIKNYAIDLELFFKYIKVIQGKEKPNETIKPKDQLNHISIDDITLEDLDTITIDDLEDFISFLKNSMDNEGTTRNRRISTLKSFYNYYSGRKVNLLDNIAKELELTKVTKKNPYYLTDEEAQRLIDNAENSEHKCLWIMFLFTGLRLSELEQVKLQDIRQNTLLVAHGKGDKEREVPLHDVVLKAINEYMTNKRKGKRGDYLFDIQKRRMQVLIKYYARKCDLDENKLSIHKLRHTAFTMLANNGEDIGVIQVIAGHSSTNTSSIYTHFNNKRKSEAVNKINLTY